MIGPLQREVDGHSVELQLMPTSKANEVLGALADVMGPALVDASGKGEVGFAGAFIKYVRGERLNWFAEQLLATCKFDGQLLFNVGPNGKTSRALYDVAFMGKLPTLYRIMGFALSENFGGFTGLLTELLELVPGLVATLGAAAARASHHTGVPSDGRLPESSAPAGGA